MASRSRLTIAKDDIFGLIANLAHSPVTRAELAKALTLNRDEWRLAQRTTVEEFLEFLQERGELKKHTLTSINYSKNLTRYTWGHTTPQQLALTICRNGYLTHASAVWTHGLTDLIPGRIYINCEQSQKPPPSGNLSQSSLDAAFKRKQRTTNLVYEINGTQIAVIAGKNTGCLGVQQLETSEGTNVRTTNLERTLIDIAVRPTYAGGPSQVLDAYRSARDRVSTNRLISLLQQLGYVYPYHQSIGFLMQKAGYSEHKYNRMKEIGIRFDFYLAHAIQEPEYNEEWRLFIPQRL